MKTYERIGIWVTMISILILVVFSIFKLLIIDKQLSLITNAISGWDIYLSKE